MPYVHPYVHSGSQDIGMEQAKELKKKLVAAGKSVEEAAKLAKRKAAAAARGGAGMSGPNGSGYPGIVPYFVSGPLHRDLNCTGAIGTLLHVVAWFLGTVLSIATLGEINTETEKDSYDYWFYSAIPFFVSFGLVLLLTLGHFGHAVFCPQTKNSWLMSLEIAEGGLAPWLGTLITTGNKVAILMTFLLLTSGHHSSADAAAVGTDGETEADATWRHYAIWTFLCQFYIMQFLEQNIAWAGPANPAVGILAEANAEAKVVQGELAKSSPV